MQNKQSRYTFKENLRWHLQGLAIFATGGLILLFIIGTIVMIVIPE